MERLEHALIAPSGLARIVQCNASLSMSKPYAAQEHETAKEGRVGHIVALHAALRALNRPDAWSFEFGQTIEGIKIDKEMLAGAEMYADALEGFNGYGETTIQIPRIHETECWGTPDFWQYSPETKTLRITDYKYGRRYIEVFENWQLVAYACGLIDHLVNTHQAFEFEIIVEFLLVQPRCYHADGPVRSWRTSATNLRAMINQAHAAAHAALEANPVARSGPECLFCPARGDCKTAHMATSAIIEYASRAERMTQSSTEVGLRLLLIDEALTMLKAVSTGLQEQATALLKAGKQVPHWKIGHTQPREVWAKSVDEVRTLGLLAGKKLTTEDYAVTPKQAVKLGISRTLVDKYSITPPGAAVLTRDDTAKHERIFSK